MVNYTEEQLEISKSLLNEPKTIEELREELDMDAQQLNQELKEMINLDVIEKQGEEYKLINYIEEKAGEQEIEGKYTIRLIIEGSSKSEKAVESEMDNLEKQLKNEPFKILEFERAEPETTENEEGEETTTTFMEVEFSVPRLSNLVYLVSNYGPSSIEVLEPQETEVTIEELQKSLNNLASSIHYYVSLILQLRQKLNQEKP